MVKSSDKVRSILGEFVSLGQRIAIALTTVNPNEKGRGGAAFSASSRRSVSHFTTAQNFTTATHFRVAVVRQPQNGAVSR